MAREKKYRMRRKTTNEEKEKERKTSMAVGRIPPSAFSRPALFCSSSGDGERGGEEGVGREKLEVLEYSGERDETSMELRCCSEADILSQHGMMASRDCGTFGREQSVHTDLLRCLRGYATTATAFVSEITTASHGGGGAHKC